MLNNRRKKMLFNLLIIIPAFYVSVCVLLYFTQERLIFFPQRLDKDFKFAFQRFEEVAIKTKDGIMLNGVLFKADSSKGLIFYLHGNAGALNSWGEAATTYTNLHYDVFMLDYRGYGKSEGEINGQSNFFSDVQTVYDEMKKHYPENKITILGYSIGTGAATFLASTNDPKRLILQAPYYSLTDMMKHKFSVLPTFILKYKFATNEYITNCKCPVVIFHGDKDEIIYYGSSLKLKPLLKPSDKLITLHNFGHNGMSDNEEYQTELKKILE
ncbi:alpha/beta hydrolase [Pinibacter soli]|uniref:Alpha/beta fold hydrolase n=1 Tax=Pinibacter soli TaxID=3044211 RepID=A0ABT6RIF8_9BACT|nr:alpha/beta fold hydrolase [Pinibacter soli]MDI3322355.1 alpha/beta fold hydrolase [Pinibacter soli]